MVRKTRRINRTVFCFLLFLVALLVSPSFAAPAATVQTATGSISVKRRGSGNFSAVRARSVLNAGDIVRTGSSKATLLFSDGSQVRLNAGATIEITAPSSVGRGRKSLFRVLGGQIWAHLRPGQAIQTRSAIAGVRGTELTMSVAPDETTTLTVVEGAVDFYNEAGAVVVNESQQSTARPRQAPTAPLTINAAGLLIEWTVDLQRALIPREKFWISFDRRIVTSELSKRTTRAKAAPQDAAAHLALGDALFDSARYSEALAAYQTAQRLAPDSTTAIRLGYAHLELDDLEAAETAFRAALALSVTPTSDAATMQPIASTRGEAKVYFIADVAPQRAPADTTRTQALCGLAWVELARDNPQDAQKFADDAIADVANSAEAHLLRGLSLMRQPGKLDEASATFEIAAAAQPQAMRYQARAWRALVFLAQNDEEGALNEARAAAQIAPQSSLVQGNLSLIYFFGNRAAESERAARLALEADPDSVAARVALGQALLAGGDSDGAARIAAQAAALDPKLAQARYLLGLADAARRDWSHAARELRQALQLAPSFLPAASTLARVYIAMGRENEAIALLTDFQKNSPDSPEVFAAFGQVYYQQGKYREAVEQYQKAASARPNSALYQAELARLLLDDNQLNAALMAGQRAVFLAPQVGQYHATLGLIADFSGLAAYAEREYRAALALDPQNALARVRLGFKSNARTSINTTTQAFLLDPAISRQFFRGGIKSELTLGTGSDDARNGLFAHRAQTRDGSAYAYGFAGYGQSRGADRAPNDDTRQYTASEYLTWTPDKRTNVLINGTALKTRGGFNGPFNTNDDRDTLATRRAVIAARRRLGKNHFLWIGGTSESRTSDGRDENADSNLFRVFDGPLFVFSTRDRSKTRTLEPEVRLDFNLSDEPNRESVFSLGAAYAHAKTRRVQDLSVFPPIPAIPVGENFDIFDSRSRVGYLQLAQRVNRKLSFIAQMRRQDVSTSLTTKFLGGPLPSVRLDGSRILPSLLVNYQLDDKTALRFFANKRRQDIGFEAFAPTETLLTSESATLPNGFSRDTRLYELDVERYFSPRTFGKVFFFQSAANQLFLGVTTNPFGSLTVPDVRRRGIGLRFEQRFGKNIFANFLLVRSSTKAVAPGVSSDGQTAPYQPKTLARLALNYVDPKGNKATLAVNHTGRFFQESQLSLERPIFPARTTVDFRFAREPSLKYEVFFGITNIFDAKQIQYRGFPAAGRRFEVGATRRF